MNAHLFSHDTGSKTCNVEGCGKTRGAKVHKDAKAQVETAEAQTFSESYDEAIATADAIKEADEARIADEQVEADAEAEVASDEVAGARQEMLPEADAATDDAEVADALAELGAEPVQEAPAKKALKAKVAAKKATKKDTATLWIGWRIANAAALGKGTLAKKVKEAKPTADLDRTLKLTAKELEELDAIATKFMETGKTGPEIYSGRALKGRIASALDKLQA